MVRFGPSGNCDKFYSLGYKDSIQSPEWLRSQGLSAYEYSFTLGRFPSEERSKAMREQAEKHDIQISVHAPYYINFCNISDEAQENNFKFLLNSLRGVKMLGGKRCVVHMGSTLKMEREEAFFNLKKNFNEFLQEFYRQGLNESTVIAPETMGKYSYIGTVDEILEVASWDKCIVPCFDFGHINSLMQGALKSKEDFFKIFEKSIDKLGFDKIDKCHIHFSKIKYGKKGELAHLTFEDKEYGPDYEPFIEVIKDLKINPVIICESKGTQTEDAATMKKYFDSLK